MTITTEDTEDRRKNPVVFAPLNEPRDVLSNVVPRRSGCPERSRKTRAGLNLRVLRVLRGNSLDGHRLRFPCHAELTTDAILDGLEHLRVVAEELLRVLASLTETLAA